MSVAYISNMAQVCMDGLLSLDGACRLMLDDIRSNLHKPLKVLDLEVNAITSGVYFFRNFRNEYAAVFKPNDEEAYAPNNPNPTWRSEMGQLGFKNIPSGQGYIREVAAYVMDKDHFASVPATTLVETYHPKFSYVNKSIKEKKIGSLQEFVQGVSKAEDLGLNFVASFDVSEVHKIVILDLRILNADRHGGNLFYNVSNAVLPYTFLSDGPKALQLIPFDHGSAFPLSPNISVYDWEWYDWPQTSVEMDQKTIDYILALNFDEELARLEAMSILQYFPNRCINLLRCSHMILQAGAKAGLRLKQIAAMIARTEDDKPSVMELLINDAIGENSVETLNKTSIDDNIDWSDTSDNEDDSKEFLYSKIILDKFQLELNFIIESIQKSQESLSQLKNYDETRSYPELEEFGFIFESSFSLAETRLSTPLSTPNVLSPKTISAHSSASKPKSPPRSCRVSVNPSPSAFYATPLIRASGNVNDELIDFKLDYQKPPPNIPLFPKSQIRSSQNSEFSEHSSSYVKSTYVAPSPFIPFEFTSSPNTPLPPMSISQSFTPIIKLSSAGYLYSKDKGSKSGYTTAVTSPDSSFSCDELSDLNSNFSPSVHFDSSADVKSPLILPAAKLSRSMSESSQSSLTLNSTQRCEHGAIFSSIISHESTTANKSKYIPPHQRKKLSSDEEVKN